MRCVGVERLPCVLFKDLMNCYFNFDGCKKDILLLSIRVDIYHVDIFLIIYVKNDNGVEIDSYNEKEISIIWIYNLKIKFTLKTDTYICYKHIYKYNNVKKIILKLWILFYYINKFIILKLSFLLPLYFLEK